MILAVLLRVRAKTVAYVLNLYAVDMRVCTDIDKSSTYQLNSVDVQ